MKLRKKETRVAGFLAPGVGMLLLFATVFSPSIAAATPASDPEGDLVGTTDSDFDIKTYGIRGDGMLFVQVYGKAARTLPTEPHVGFAYVFETDDGIWAINGHQEPHSTDLPQWHAERILVDGTCIQAIDVESERPLIIAGTNVMVKATGVTEIFSVSTVEFHLLVDEPDNPPPGTECIAEVAHIFDTA
jgi:hypothetical protein